MTRKMRPTKGSAGKITSRSFGRKYHLTDNGIKYTVASRSHGSHLHQGGHHLHQTIYYRPFRGFWFTSDIRYKMIVMRSRTLRYATFGV